MTLPKNVRIEQSCFYHAQGVNQIIEQVIASDKLRMPGQPKSRVVLQAGSASWMRIKPEEDDGKILSHYSYVYDKQPAGYHLLRMEQKGLPEIHVWNAILTDGHPPQIIDLTTLFLPELCKTLHNLEWTAPKPPDYLWCTGDQIPDNWLYQPHQEATKLVYAVLGQAIEYSPILKV